MRLESLDSFELRIPFRAAFKHASAERVATQTIWVEARAAGGNLGVGEGCPREYVTGENLPTAQAFISAHAREWLATPWDLAALLRWTEGHRADIDRNPAAWAAVELALLDLLGKTQARSVEAVLGLPELSGIHSYTAILGQSSPKQFAAQLAYYLQAGFRHFKIKLAGTQERDGPVVRALAAAGVLPGAVRADANNLWPDSATAIRELAALDFPFFAVEEPLVAGDLTGMRAVARAQRTSIVLDESLLRLNQLADFAADAENWMVNVRISKMGGLLRTLELLREARRKGIRVIIGAHVGETSVLTRAALTAATAAGDLLVAQEGAFGTHLLEEDIVDRPLMFGRAGALDVIACQLPGAPGLGLVPSATLARYKK